MEYSLSLLARRSSQLSKFQKVTFLIMTIPLLVLGLRQLLSNRFNCSTGIKIVPLRPNRTIIF